MAAALLETAKKLFTPETLRSAGKQSERIHIVSVSLRRAIKKFLRDNERVHMKRKVLRLSQSFCQIKDFNSLLPSSTSRELVEDPFKSMEPSKRWKIKSAYGDIGLKYNDDETVAYVASRMPAVYSACHRVLREVRRRLPDFAPARVLDFGAGTGSAFWALRDVWPRSLEKVNLVEPSKFMQRACDSLLQDMKDLPLIHTYDSIQELSQKIGKHERRHDLVIASYVLGEIPSCKDQIAVARQLWNLTQDVLVLVEPGTPQGSSIIHLVRSHILWMENERCRNSRDASTSTSDGDLQNNAEKAVALPLKRGAFVVAPCAHDGACPLANSQKYCHFVQRLERTSSQRAYKRSKGQPLRGFEDEKFCFIVLRRGERPKANWPLDEMKFETLKEQQARRDPEDLEIDYEDQFVSETDEDHPDQELVKYESDVAETDGMCDDQEEIEDEAARADLGSGWGRILFTPVRRGKRITLDVCRSTKRDGSEGSFDRIVVTKSKNPALHQQARRSLWGDLWPF